VKLCSRHARQVHSPSEWPSSIASWWSIFSLPKSFFTQVGNKLYAIAYGSKMCLIYRLVPCFPCARMAYMTWGHVGHTRRVLGVWDWECWESECVCVWWHPGAQSPEHDQAQTPRRLPACAGNLGLGRTPCNLSSDGLERVVGASRCYGAHVRMRQRQWYSLFVYQLQLELQHAYQCSSHIRGYQPSTTCD
jgi:hypothetical protein